MNRRRFSDLFRREQPLTDNVRAALDELSHIAATRPPLSQHAAVLADLLPVMFAQVGTGDSVLAMDELRARAKLESGTPILRGESVSLDRAVFAKRWRAISKRLSLGATGSVHHTRKEEGAAGPETRARVDMATLFDRGDWSCEDAVRELLSGDVAGIVSQAEAAGIAGESLKTVLRMTLFPVLCQSSIQHQALVQQCGWRVGCCPVCGSWPLLAEFRGLEQTRFLRCGLCAAGWEFPRLQCPFCTNRDHHQLGYFHVEQEEDKFRAATCEVCHSYVKIASTLEALDGPQLLVMDVATLHLDLAALERGYRCSP